MSDIGKNIAEQIVCQLSRLIEVAPLTDLTKTFSVQVTCSTREKYSSKFNLNIPTRKTCSKWKKQTVSIHTYFNSY